MSKRSVVWQHFIVVMDDAKKVECKLCKQRFAYHSSTTNMTYHLKTAHPQYSTSASTASSGLTQTTLDQNSPISEKRKREITEGIVDFIALDMRPVNLIEGVGFKDMMKILEPGYTVPKRETVMQALTAKYETTKEKVLESIKNSQAVSFTTDMWTSLRMESYMTVTAHFITEAWGLQCLVLETKQMEENHTAATIAQRLGEVADKYEIPGCKRVAVVHDNAANMILCADILGREEKWAGVKGIRCAGHTLQLCINATLNQDHICRTVVAARLLVAHFKKRTKARKGLKEKQKEQKVVEHVLIQDVSMRWNSSQTMLARLIEQRWPVTAVLSDPNYTGENERNLDLTPAQWNMAEDISNVLKPIVTLTELQSEEENASLSATIPMLANLKRRHLAPVEDDSPTTKSLKTRLVEESDNRWQLKDRLFESSIYVQAAVVDPRFKLLSFLDDAKRDVAYINVSQLADRLSAEGDRDSSTPTDKEVPAPKRKKTDKEREIDMLMCGDEREKEFPGDSKKEVKYYLQDRTKVDAGPLAWWGKNEDRYPRLARAAKYLLSIPATSTPSERIFSKAGFIFNKTRSCLLPENVDKLVFLSHNLKRLGK
ncbi:zinc finger BED domain-containing protein 1-like [Oncorhynchus kisutch]|uniref:zinc finger BED domain-containing protein 1-like n=1 Tax=Oncorhynchus kisutch TaxID=8019 RepID=UPI0009A056F8|nr:zinc finger BED domain-containing protein 1-like [Oncorhynchus kisutch]